MSFVLFQEMGDWIRKTMPIGTDWTVTEDPGGGSSSGELTVVSQAFA
jgi:hypothetical protein